MRLGRYAGLGALVLLVGAVLLFGTPTFASGVVAVTRSAVNPALGSSPSRASAADGSASGGPTSAERTRTGWRSAAGLAQGCQRVANEAERDDEQQSAMGGVGKR